MPPPTSHLIRGKVYDIYSVPLGGATVIVKDITLDKSSTLTTNSSGEYIANLVDLGSWSVGDSLSVKASKTNYGTKTETLTANSSPAQTQNITLAETEIYEKDTSDTQVGLRKTILLNREGEDITHSNKLPIQESIVRDVLHSHDKITTITYSSTTKAAIANIKYSSSFVGYEVTDTIDDSGSTTKVITRTIK